MEYFLCPGKNTVVGCHALPPGDHPSPGIKPRSPTLQADSLPSEPPGKPREVHWWRGCSGTDHVFIRQWSVTDGRWSGDCERTDQVADQELNTWPRMQWSRGCKVIYTMYPSRSCCIPLGVYSLSPASLASPRWVLELLCKETGSSGGWWYVHAKSVQSCWTLCEPTDCSLPGSSVYGILQARILEWIAIPFSRGSSQPRDRTLVSCIAGRFFNIWATEKPCILFHTVNHFFIFLIFWGTKIFNVEEFQSIFRVVHAFCITFLKLLIA